MDIFVRNVPTQATNKQVERALEGPLRECGINQDYHIEKIKGKPLAIVTILSTERADKFLDVYGVLRNAPREARSRKPLKLDRMFLKCSKSYNEPSDFSLRALAYAASQKAAIARTTASAGNPSGKKSNHRSTTRFSVANLQCGVWEYAGSNLVFTTHYKSADQGTITFGHKEAILLLGNTNSEHVRLDVRYYDCENVVLGKFHDPTITITLSGRAPKMFKVHGEDVLSAGLTALVLGAADAKKKDVRKTRVTGVDADHSKIAGVCFVYRMTLADPAMLSTVRSLLTQDPRKPATMNFPTSLHIPEKSWGWSKMRLDYELSDTQRFGAKPFGILFQVDRIVRNGALPPARMLELLPKISRIHAKYGTEATLAALCRFYRQIPLAGPDTEASQLSKDALKEMLERYASTYDQHAPENPYELSKRHAHINLIHKVIVTPTGTYLEGPEPEPTNRVLRKYHDQTDKFVRVLFQDEDGGSVHYDPRASQELIYHQRFKGVLDGVISIAGQGFSFLGFSHSSLRSQSCWFMAPLYNRDQGGLLLAPQVIKQLGDFTHIRTPARAAARIGQCFTDTTASVTLRAGEKGSLDMVERNGRDFSDGVGTISRALLESVWRVYGTRQALKPTALQIRYQGAKGMVALDSRLKGKQLLLRSNMIKFGGSPDRVLEICGAAFRPLPMVLNRQFIKILEDLGIPTDVFMELQNYEVNKLRCMLTSAVNTATLLETLEMSKAPRLPELIQELDEVSIDYHADHFLSGVVEMAVVSRVRDIKYRGRIIVEKGLTLFGIMDETGCLQEGQIYVVSEKAPEGGRTELIQRDVIITRSPAMHPGDVQVVDAVSVPDDSPLKELSNVVVFSQQGARDLPSQLSGGDLDGDLYNVIWDSRLKPRRYSTPADYPKVTPVELDRAVVAGDMSDFFITFMMSDQLGMLCNVHMQLADQKPLGTFSAECIQLAQMASTAVDYSKTGIPINVKDTPRYDRCRPDFMAPSPRMGISEQGYINLEEDDNEDDDAFEGLDTERRPYRYYESQKALGHLYRNIDERQFIANIQKQHRAHGPAVDHTQATVLPDLLKHVLHFAYTYGVQHAHALDHAREVRSSYEEGLIEIMYSHCPTSHTCLSEQEVFSGTILGRQGGAQGKPLRELSQTMRERFESVGEYAMLRIIKGDQHAVQAALAAGVDDGYDDREIEAFPRAIACLEVAVQESGLADRQAGELKSFGYIAAGVCLREWRRYLITTFGVRSLPRV